MADPVKMMFVSTPLNERIWKDYESKVRFDSAQRPNKADPVKMLFVSTPLNERTVADLERESVSINFMISEISKLFHFGFIFKMRFIFTRRKVM